MSGGERRLGGIRVWLLTATACRQTSQTMSHFTCHVLSDHYGVQCTMSGDESRLGGIRFWLLTATACRQPSQTISHFTCHVLSDHYGVQCTMSGDESRLGHIRVWLLTAVGLQAAMTHNQSLHMSRLESPLGGPRRPHLGVGANRGHQGVTCDKWAYWTVQYSTGFWG